MNGIYTTLYTTYFTLSKYASMFTALGTISTFYSFRIVPSKLVSSLTVRIIYDTMSWNGLIGHERYHLFQINSCSHTMCVFLFVNIFVYLLCFRITIKIQRSLLSNNLHIFYLLLEFNFIIISINFNLIWWNMIWCA